MSSEVSSNKKYLNQKVNPILELMIASLMKHRPENPIDFMQTWLNQKGVEMEKKINSRLSTRPEGIQTTSESEDDNEEMDAFELEMEKKQLVRKNNPNDMRISVSAEAYGDHNKKEDFHPPIHAKPEETILHIMDLLSQSVLF